MNNHIEFINPEGMMQSPAFSQVAVTSGSGTTIYIGGQNAVTKEQTVVGKGDIVAQTAFILTNIETAIKASGATLNDLVKLTIYIVHGQDARRGFAGAQEFLKKLKSPPVITGVVVAGLTNPDYLVEIEAIAFKRS